MDGDFESFDLFLVGLDLFDLDLVSSVASSLSEEEPVSSVEVVEFSVDGSVRSVEVSDLSVEDLDLSVFDLSFDSVSDEVELSSEADGTVEELFDGTVEELFDGIVESLEELDPPIVQPGGTLSPLVLAALS